VFFRQKNISLHLASKGLKVGFGPTKESEMRYLFHILVMVTCVLATACRHTKPGTHVEVINKDGSRIYMAGAVAPGVSQSQACPNAIKRAVAAAALRFTQDFSEIGDELADELGASDGEPLLNRYAKAQLMDASVQDIDFEPMNHRCMATVRWKAPLFLQDALRDFSKGLKSAATNASSATAQNGPAATRTPAAAAAPVEPCAKFQRKLEASIEHENHSGEQLDECLRRTDGDKNICHRYQLKAEKGAAQRQRASDNLKKCQGTF